MLTLDQFIKKYEGILCGNTDDNFGQCTGLVNLWIDNLNLQHCWGHAKDIYANAKTSEYEKIENSPNAYPQAGDIVCWNSNMGGGYGHIAIVKSSNKSEDSFTVFEQNNPLGSPPIVHEYLDWSNVIGWLTPKVSFEIPGIRITDDIPSDIEDLLSLKDFDWYSKYWTFEDFFRDSILTHKELKNQKSQYETQYKTLESNYEVMDSQYNAQLKAKTNEVYEKNTHIIELEGALSSLKEAVQHNITPLNLKNDKGYVYSTKDLLASLVERLTTIFK